MIFQSSIQQSLFIAFPLLQPTAVLLSLSRYGSQLLYRYRFPVAAVNCCTAIAFPLRQSTAVLLSLSRYGSQLLYRHLSARLIYSLSCISTLLYAGRIILSILINSSILWALHPTILAMANMGVYISSGISSILYTNPL